MFLVLSQIHGLLFHSLGKSQTPIHIPPIYTKPTTKGEFLRVRLSKLNVKNKY